METRRDDEVPRALRGALEQHRRLDLDELVLVHVAMHRLHHAMSHLQHSLHAWAAQVEVAVLEPCRLIRLDLVFDLEWRRLRRGDHLELGSGHFHVARRHARVLVAFRPAADRALDADHELRTKV